LQIQHAREIRNIEKTNRRRWQRQQEEESKNIEKTYRKRLWRKQGKVGI
jgi:hypothetical protein